MNYSRAFSYVFEDKQWLSKVLIAGLISLIPIVGQFYLLGWMIEIIRRVKAGRTDILPTTHFSYFLTLGLKMFVVSLIYSIPVIILSCILNLVNGAAGHQDSNFITAFVAGLGCLGGILTLVVNFAVSLLGTYGAIKLAQTDQIKACLDFNDAFSTIKNNLSTFIIVELLAIVAGLIQSAGLILCVIPVILTAPYGTAVVGNLVGQLWNNLKESGSKDKPFRGSVNSEDDVIEEAPFTTVQDIEQDPAVEPVADDEPEEDILVASETIVYTDEPEDEPVEEPAAEDVAEPVSEPEEPEAPAEPEAPEQPEENQDNEIPSFE